jgi:hypothetical protein
VGIGWNAKIPRVSIAVNQERSAVPRDEYPADAVTECDESTHSKPDRLLLSECRSWACGFTQLVNAAADAANVDPRALGVRTLLHLPRVAKADGWVTTRQIEHELNHSARILHRDTEKFKHALPAGKPSLQELEFVEDFDPATSDKLFASLHYLRNAPRRGSRNFALVEPEKRFPVTICSVSPFEWTLVGNHILSEFGIPQEMIRDVSRVYSCDAAPPNAISSLLSRVRTSLNGTVDLLVTAVDPNLGFRGASYRAAGWQLWLTVQPRPYLYHNSRYASPRQLRQRFGTSNLDELEARHPDQRFARSRTRLLAPWIYCCRTRGATEAIQLSGKCPLRRR